MGSQTKMVNWCLKTYLRCFSSKQPKQWHFWLSWTEFWYNTSYHTTNGKCHFKLRIDRPPPIVIWLLNGKTLVESLCVF